MPDRRPPRSASARISGPGDYIASTHRGHGHSIAKGCDVTGMMLELFAKDGGLCGGKGGSMHIADLDQGMLGANGIVGGGPPLVVGAALTAKTLKTGNVAVSFTGDGGSNQGTTFEAMNMAVVLRLAGDLRVREQRLWRVHRRLLCGAAAATSPVAPPGSDCRPSR